MEARSVSFRLCRNWYDRCISAPDVLSLIHFAHIQELLLHLWFCSMLGCIVRDVSGYLKLVLSSFWRKIGIFFLFYPTYIRSTFNIQIYCMHYVNILYIKHFKYVFNIQSTSIKVLKKNKQISFVYDLQLHLRIPKSINLYK